MTARTNNNKSIQTSPNQSQQALNMDIDYLSYTTTIFDADGAAIETYIGIQMIHLQNDSPSRYQHNNLNANSQTPPTSGKI